MKSGYWLAIYPLITTSSPPTYGTVALKEKIWKAHVPAKLKHFLLRIESRSIVTGNNLRRRHVTTDVICKRCWLEEETEEHLFFNSPYAKKIWRTSRIANTIIDSLTTSYEDKLEACLQVSNVATLNHYQDLSIWVLWRIWKCRNMLLYQHRHLNWKNVLINARSDAEEWKNAERQETDTFQCNSVSSRVRQKEIWRVPPEHWLKCNVDASFINTQEPATAGWVVRDANGGYQGAVQAQGYKVCSPLESELQAILMAIQYCWRRGYKKIIIESDCKQAIGILNDKVLPFASYNWKREIRWWADKIQDISFQWINWEDNKVIDVLARL